VSLLCRFEPAAKDVTDQVQGMLIYRIKYKTKDGERLRSNTYNVSPFP
jgi:hypothetical protein